MSDLISRSAVINTILTENQRCITSTGHEMSISMICDFLLNQPTAYDVDAVVEELENEKIVFCGVRNLEETDTMLIDDAIAIVRKGGV